MLRYCVTWLRMLRCEEGQDLAEYALLIALIAVTLLLVLGAMAGGVANTLNYVRNAIYHANDTQIAV